jgi:exopolysaccharide biosynthesis polyprenyl glycosylphosphotransferase
MSTPHPRRASAGSSNAATSAAGEDVVLRTAEVLKNRPPNSASRDRGWIVRRALLTADVLGLLLAFTIAELLFGLHPEGRNPVSLFTECVAFLLTLPMWVLVAKLHGLYDNDEVRTNHSTADEITSTFHLVTTGVWIFVVAAWLSDLANVKAPKIIAFWLLAYPAVIGARLIARAVCRRSLAYQQNTVIVGAGKVGQLIARKIMHHPEYGLNVVGFVDADPRVRRADIVHVPVLGEPKDLGDVVRSFNVDRVVVAFSRETQEAQLKLVRSVRHLPVQVDIVPRMFDLVGPRVGVYTVEGLTFIGLPPVRVARTSRWIKRCIDVVGASLGLIALAPVFGWAAWKIRRDTPGPVFFRQTRLGQDRREFTMLKFRTMRVGNNDVHHRAHILATRDANAEPGDNGLFKPDRGDVVTRSGAWLRRTSLDEIPQLLNVLRGDMSLVGPRPCIPYELEVFQPHQYERFLVPPGLTGLWQVTARAHATHSEALDMDVAYARDWSLWLDLWLICRTPLALLRQRTATT